MYFYSTVLINILNISEPDQRTFKGMDRFESVLMNGGRAEI